MLAKRSLLQRTCKVVSNLGDVTYNCKVAQNHSKYEHKSVLTDHVGFTDLVLIYKSDGRQLVVEVKVCVIMKSYEKCRVAPFELASSIIIASVQQWLPTTSAKHDT